MNPLDHIGLVRKEVCRWAWSFNAVVTKESLEQEGMFGVLRALETYDPEKGKFSTYALPWIRHFIQREVYYHVRTVRYPMNLSKERYKKRQPIPLTVVSLDAPMDESESNSGTMANRLRFSAENYGPAACEHHDMAEQVAHLLSTLPENEAKLLKMRFFEDKSLQECGDAFGFSRERARQVEAKALASMASALTSREDSLVSG